MAIDRQLKSLDHRWNRLIKQKNTLLLARADYLCGRRLTHVAAEDRARAIFPLRKEGHTQEQIGKILGISRETVKYYLSGGKASYRAGIIK